METLDMTAKYWIVERWLKSHNYICVHEQYAIGYPQRYVDVYNGKYGTGYLLHVPDMTRKHQHIVRYYIKTEKPLDK
ncbi:MAG: hypothetical protein MJZ03_04020 [archaeon]|nr:hypothetical protein [archaeon]